MGKRPVRGTDGLGLLKMGVTRKDQVHPSFGESDEGGTQIPEERIEAIGRPHPPKAQIRCDLIVPRSARVQLACDLSDFLTEEPLDEGVYVFVECVVEGSIRNPFLHRHEPRVDPGTLFCREDTRPDQRPCPGSAPPHILLPEPTIHVERAIERLHFSR
jgi:hypothetical protein